MAKEEDQQNDIPLYTHKNFLQCSTITRNLSMNA